ncbi:MAG: 23S rRNA (uracil(1939)-C(5))-methyltransferase RlmD [Coriobacteriales bacterium]|jgi:23S rRNA (uracil1939-C5)-methyltransferase|nr:23S rRNA (uracil(1939)-C(5))-methyltransferase RlmD [Coriobacteriales bacterium]
MQHEVSISALAYTGLGLSHLADGKVAFVAGGLPGDRLVVEIINDKGNYVDAQLIRFVEKSGERLPAACQHAPTCGGCPWQCLAYPVQLAWKRRFVVDALLRIGHIETADNLVSEVHASPNAWHYRNKMEFTLFSDDGRLKLGMYHQGSQQLVAINNCPLLPENLAGIPGSLAGSLSYAFGKDKVWPYRIGIRNSIRTNQSELALWSTPTGARRGFLTQLLGEILPASSLVRVLTRENNSKRQVIKTEVLSGRGHWTEHMAGVRFMVSAPSFFQVNTEVAETMVAKVLDLVAPAGKRIWDLYSGVGSFSLPMALAGGQVTAVEIAGSAIRDFHRNCRATGLDSQVGLISGDVARAFQDSDQLTSADIAVIDPPRSGLQADTLAGLSKASLHELVYVSCDPQTLARDSARLAMAGFQLIAAYPFDLFPQSYHVETVAYFQR